MLYINSFYFTIILLNNKDEFKLIKKRLYASGKIVIVVIVIYG
jgi:hypothetical protein